MINTDFVEVQTKMRRRRVLKMAWNRKPKDQLKIPAIRFSGNYLEDLGFVVDGFFELIVQEDRSILLKPLPPNTPQPTLADTRRTDDYDPGKHYLAPCTSCQATMQISLTDHSDMECHGCGKIFKHPSRDNASPK